MSQHFKTRVLLVVIGIVCTVSICTYLNLGNTSMDLSMDQSSSLYQHHYQKDLQLYNLADTDEYKNGQIHKQRTISSHVLVPQQQTIKSESNFPMPQKVPPNLPWGKKDKVKVTPKSILKQPWVGKLWTFLHTKIDMQFPVVITTSSFSYQPSLLNWLAHALITTDSVKNILILSLDEKLHSFLLKKKFSSLYLPPFVGSQKEGIFCVEIARLLVMRLINFWGYDVINYDSDAFILKNPQSLFDLYPESHVIGSESYMPRDLHDKWGVTLCMGVAYIKASPETGKCTRYTSDIIMVEYMIIHLCY